MNFIRNLFFGTPAIPRTIHHKSAKKCRNGKPVPATHAPEIKLAVSKAVMQLAFIAQSYEFTLCEGSLDDLKADLQTMLAYGDLKIVSLELLGASDRVLFEFCLNFQGRPPQGTVDTGRGVELPMFDRRLVANKRLLIQRKGRAAAYEHLLKLNWHDAATFKKMDGVKYYSDHAVAISGGRQTAAIHIANLARHQFAITAVGNKGFAFARDAGSGRDGVFVLKSQLPESVRFAIGAEFTAVLVQTPRGFQVRSCSAL